MEKQHIPPPPTVFVDTPTGCGNSARAAGNVFTCAVRLTPAGLRLEQSIGDQRLVAQTHQTEDELYGQDDVVRTVGGWLNVYHRRAV